MNDDEFLELPLKITGAGESASKAAQELRSNSQLDEIFNQIQGGGKSNRPPPLTEAMRKSARQQFIESKAHQKWLADNEKTQALNLRRIVRTGRKEARDEARAEARDKLKAARDQAREEKRLNRELSNNIRSTNERSMYAAEVQANRRNQRARVAGAIGEGIGGAVSKGYYAGAGAVAYGFKDSLQGGEFAREFKLLAQEMAGIFAPVISTASHGMGRIRERLEETTGKQQDYLMAGALGLGAVELGYGIRPAAKALASRAALGGASSAGFGLTAAAPTLLSGAGLRTLAGRSGLLTAGVLTYGMFERRDSLKASRENPISAREVRDAGFSEDMSRAQKRELLDMHRSKFNEEYRDLDQTRKDRSILGFALSTLGVNPVYSEGAYGYGKRMEVMNRRGKLLSEIEESEFKGKDGLPGTTPENHRKLKFTGTVGFGEVGSTAALLQQQLLETARDTPKESEESTWLRKIFGLLSLDKDPNSLKLLNAPPS